MIRDHLINQKEEFSLKVLEPYIQRDVNIQGLDASMIKVVIGPRRAGKSFYAIHELSKKDSVAYVNFDDEELIQAKDYDEIMRDLNTIYPDIKKLFFDEIQNLPKWELFINRLQRQGYDITVSGSNANLLSKELATHLTGRHLKIELLPFSFKEYIKYIKAVSDNDKKSALQKYIQQGGYPEVIIKNIDYKSYLSTLFDAIIYKDIIKRYNIRIPAKMTSLAEYLIANIACEYSFKNVSKILDVKSYLTIQKYAGYLEESYLIFHIDKFSYKSKERIGANKKIYALDTGMINTKAFQASPNYGRLYENIVAIELRRKGGEIYYWKNTQNEEVDFLVKEGITVKELIQVCYDVSQEKTKNREIRALLKASKDTICNNLTIITADYEAITKERWNDMTGTIKYIPLWKWLTQ